MKRIAVVHPTSLLGKELREQLDRRPENWSEIRLLSTREEEVGTVTEQAGQAALVERFETAKLAEIDLLMLCDDMDHTAPLLDGLPTAVTALVLSRNASGDIGQVLVDGINLDGTELSQILVSPHPAVLALSRLLLPLQTHGLSEVTATILQPASVHGEDALDEVFSQTRSLLSFRPIGSGGPFGGQIAFNLLLTDNGCMPQLCHDLEGLLGSRLRTSLQILQAGVFHGLSVSACCRFDQDPGLDEVRNTLEHAFGVELVADPEDLGPVLAASRAEVLLGRIRRAEEWPGTYWFWGVADHLVLEAGNALAIAAARLSGR